MTWWQVAGVIIGCIGAISMVLLLILSRWVVSAAAFVLQVGMSYAAGRRR